MGGATVAMIAMALGFATNIALDYVFVWALNWGMPALHGRPLSDRP